jgi:hypothetical protein
MNASQISNEAQLALSQISLFHRFLPAAKKLSDKEKLPCRYFSPPLKIVGVYGPTVGETGYLSITTLPQRVTTFTTGGFIIGDDYRITDYFAIGLMGSYAYTATDLQPSGDINVNTGRGGLYFTYFSHGFYINGAAYGGHNTYNTSRQGILGAANGSTSGGEFSTFGQAGYDFHFGKFAVGPLFALQ